MARNVDDYFGAVLPNRVQVRFTASGFYDAGAVEAGLDAFEVVRVQP